MPTPPPPAFDDASPWGRYAPRAGVRALLALAHAVPPPLARLVLLLRRPVKYGVHTPLDVTVWGLKLRLLPRGNMSEQKLLFAPQLFDRTELALLRGTLRPGGCFVDIGANAGVYSFWARRCMGASGRVLAVEPDPEMRRRMAFNVAGNALPGIEVAPLALSDHAGEAELWVDPGQRGQNTLEAGEAARAGGARHKVKVALATLPELLRERGIERVDALKIDIEGHEPPVLRHFFDHAPPALWPALVITEFKPATAAGIEALFTARGYRRRTTTDLNFVFERPPS
jgi:FkbM family methyltransferase